MEHSQRTLARILADAGGDDAVLVHTSLSMRDHLSYAGDLDFWENIFECIMTVSLDGTLAVDLPPKDICIFVQPFMDTCQMRSMLKHLLAWSKKNPTKHATLVFMPGLTQGIGDLFGECDPLWRQMTYRERFAPGEEGKLEGLVRGTTCQHLMDRMDLKAIGIRAAEIPGQIWKVTKAAGVKVSMDLELESEESPCSPLQKGIVFKIDPEQTQKNYSEREEGDRQDRVYSTDFKGWITVRRGRHEYCEQSRDVTIEAVPTEDKFIMCAFPPVARDIFSMGHPHFMRYTLRGDTLPLSWLSQMICAFECNVRNSKFESIEVKGDFAGVVFKMLMGMHDEKNKAEREGRAQGMPIPVGGRLVILDRLVDLPAACLNAHSYNGMVDELYETKDEARKTAMSHVNTVDDKMALMKMLSFDEDDKVFDVTRDMQYIKAMDETPNPLTLTLTLTPSSLTLTLIGSRRWTRPRRY